MKKIILLIVMFITCLPIFAQSDVSLNYLIDDIERVESYIIRNDESINIDHIEEYQVDWQPLHILSKDEQQNLKKMVLRVPLPESLAEINRIFLISYYAPFEIYYNGNIIYEDMKQEEYIHIFTLTPEEGEKYLYFSYDSYIPGFKVPFSMMFINGGNRDTPFLFLIRKLIFVHVINYAVSIFFLIMAFISFLLIIKSSLSIRKHMFAVLIYCLVIGLDFGLNTLFMAQTGIDPVIYYTLDSIMFELYILMILIMAEAVFQKYASKYPQYYKYAILLLIASNLFVTHFFAAYPVFDIINIIVYCIVDINILYLIIKNRKRLKRFIVVIAILFIIAPLLLFVARSFSGLPIISLGYVVLSIMILYIYLYNFFVEFRKNENKLYQTTISLRDRENKILRLEQEKLRSRVSHLKGQLNPHFLFNSLSTLIGIIASDQEKATNYVEELATTYRYILQTDGKDLIELDNELEIIESYDYLLNMKYGNNYELNIKIPGRFKDFRIPPLSLQTIIENVFKHNFINDENKMVIDVYIMEGNLIVENTYNPQSTSFRYVKKHHGIGQDNLVKIYKLMDKPIPTFYEKDGKYYAILPLID